MSKFKVGDRVSFGGLKGTVNKIREGCRFCVIVQYDKGGGHDFTEDGKFLLAHTKPLLKKLKKKSVKFKVGDEVIVRGTISAVHNGDEYPLHFRLSDGLDVFPLTRDGRFTHDGPVILEKVKKNDK